MQNFTPRKIATPARGKDPRFFPVGQEQTNESTSLEFQLYAREKELEEYDISYASLQNKIKETYKEFIKYGIEETAKFAKKYPIKLDAVDDTVKGKKLEAENMLRTINFVAAKIIDMKKNIDSEINKRGDINYTKSEEYEDLLHKLENDVRFHIKVEEKLKTLVDTAYLRIEDLEKKVQVLESSIHTTKEEAMTKVEKMKELVKNQTSELKMLKEDHAARRKITSSGYNDLDDHNNHSYNNNNTFTTPKDQTSYGKGDFYGSKSMMSATIGPDKFNSLVKDLQKTKSSGMRSKEDLKALRRTNEKELTQEQSTKHNEMLLSRLKIQVSERDKEIERLKRDFDNLFAEMKKMKQKELEANKKVMAKEVLSDKNPNIAALIEKKERNKEEKIDELNGKLRRYATNEKRLFVKEKAFEMERAEYHDRILYLSDRVAKLLKINEELSKETHMTLLERAMKRTKESTTPIQDPDDLGMGGDLLRQSTGLGAELGSTAESFGRRNIQTPSHHSGRQGSKF